jgi:integrase/recombinase XerD
MNKKENARFDELYECHLKMLKLQGKADRTIELYSRPIRRIRDYFDCVPDKLTPDDFKEYFIDLIKTHSWSTVKTDRLGLQFFWRHVLKKDWQWIDIVKPPKVHTIPDILTPPEVERLIGATRKLRYRVFLLTTYSMGLRLEEALSLQVSDIDAERKQIHIRRGKGHKDRMVALPDLTLYALRTLWSKHRNPNWLFPNPVGSAETIQKATRHMDKGGAQNAMKVVVKECGIKKKSQFIH